jgi:hypothetical protein
MTHFTCRNISFVTVRKRGKTPAEACEIEIERKNKWKTLIQKASNKNP